ncbi:DUF6924 domain-containing protein [Streptomyces sp. NPDC056704]|uniref:DUF6924 domain-containing protein n=1 Tax=Streptomyces sp. NPDC056704 TaxID=3345917 RepID=UPI00367ADB11
MSDRTGQGVADRDEFAALVIRTDFGDEGAWTALRRALSLPWGPGDFEPRVHVVDDPSWAGHVLAAVAADDELAVVFLADGGALRTGQGALLAVSTLTREECESDEEFEAEGGEFRTVPAGVHEIHANLMIANLDFADFADAAEAAPDGVFRSL